jgi:hypothetical protein
MHTNDHKYNLTMLAGKIAVAIATIGALLFTFGLNLPYAHAASLGSDPNSKTADSLPTSSPDSCFLWDGVQSNLYGGAPDGSIAEFVPVLDHNGAQMGVIEIDDTVYANSCSKAGSSNIVMSGLVYVHWSQWQGSVLPPHITVRLVSTIVASGPRATWSAGVSANAGVSTPSGSSSAGTAGASVHIDLGISPTDATVLNSDNTISDQPSATFSYQNLEGSVFTPVNSQVVQKDAITITVLDQNAQLTGHNEKEVLSFT